jgi:hypothetical protein
MHRNVSNPDASPRAAEPLRARAHIDWRAAVSAGVIAGLVFLVVEMMLVWLVQGMSPWAPPRMMAAMVLGPEVLPPPDTFSLMAVMTAMLVHFPLSIVYGLVLGWAVHRLEMGMALLVGAAFGLIAVYAVNFYLIAPIAFPWFVEARNMISIVAHVIFGVVLAGVYVAMRRH